MNPKFTLGQCVATPAALAVLALNDTSPVALLNRHVQGDWGKMDEEDSAQNEAAIPYRDRIMSSYDVGDETVWVITDPDWQTTTILLPEDY